MADNYDDYSKEELIKVLRERDRKPRFGLVWERKEIEHERAINDDFVALDLDESLSCGNAPYQNLIIEGDNFDALRYLRMTYSGKVKCIYIDPPYNTGNKDFVYNDRFIDKDDVFKHSKWLEFMYQRLLLARDLLAEDGVIFVSIDDNEVFNLAPLMNQIFGERNFIATIIWQKVYSPKNTAMHFSDDHEYVLVYSINRDRWQPNPMPRNDAQTKAYKNPDNDPRGPWKASDMTARNYYSKGLYEVKGPTGKKFDSGTRYWRQSYESFLNLEKDNRIWWGPKGNNVPALKRFLSEVKKGVVPQTLWKYEEVGHTQKAKKEVNEILQFEDTASVFSTPKPISLIERIIRIATQPDDIIIDFFAGSGTSAHAVLKLNAEDGGNRRFILVSNAEATETEPGKNLCRDVCAERVRRVINGYKNKKGEDAEGLGDNFAYLKTRRISSETIFSEIEHQQVWTALQLIHSSGLSAFNSSTNIQELETPDNRILYLCQLTDKELATVNERLRIQQSIIAYCWQPALLRQHIEDERLTCLPIPQFLVDRFSTGVKA